MSEILNRKEKDKDYKIGLEEMMGPILSLIETKNLKLYSLGLNLIHKAIT